MNNDQTVRFALALERLAGDQDLLAAMASMVAEDAPPVLDSLQTLLDSGDANKVAESAHKLKGMFSTFETGAPVTDLEELIDAARVGKVERARAVYNSCQSELHLLCGEIEALTK